MHQDFAANIEGVRKRMVDACERSARDISQVCLIGVTKTVSIERIREGAQAGIMTLGENYVQEARNKMELLSGFPLSWHFIGHLQSNKAKQAVELFDLIHTVDRLSLARELNRAGEKLNRKIPILLQVNIGDESTKSGVHPEGLTNLYGEAAGMEALAIRGLMVLPPYLEDPEAVRPYFQKTRELLEALRERAPHGEEFKELSMGMSHDFEVAIEEGATMIRVGTALYGVRPRKGA